MKNFLITSFIFYLAFYSNFAFAEVPTITADEAYKYYVLDRIDGPDIPDNVKQFAKDNNCFEVMKSYYWSHKIFKNNGGVYSCGINGKAQFIYDNEKKLRFARWYEKHKFRKPIFEF